MLFSLVVRVVHAKITEAVYLILNWTHIDVIASQDLLGHTVNEQVKFYLYCNRFVCLWEAKVYKVCVKPENTFHIPASRYLSNTLSVNPYLSDTVFTLSNMALNSSSFKNIIIIIIFVIVFALVLQKKKPDNINDTRDLFLLHTFR